MLSVYLNPSGLLKLNLLLLSLACFLLLENSWYLHLLYSRLKAVKAIAMQVLTILIKMHN